MRALIRARWSAGRDGGCAIAVVLSWAYFAVERTLVLIRPDGYIALISDAGEMAVVEGYLRAMGWPGTESVGAADL